ncbi:hypothetical protein CCACVL1_26472 [Corchorus capsularis]|uniref:Uncharacterized protein n=1 Tax=Corchorus capsularis TaxID=210143 RepID=A0A1R3GER1_COCAP|nr:hypothetical protein CCACVL1_26472 [Corchorus capsularis]
MGPAILFPVTGDTVSVPHNHLPVILDVAISYWFVTLRYMTLQTLPFQLSHEPITPVSGPQKPLKIKPKKEISAKPTRKLINQGLIGL